MDAPGWPEDDTRAVNAEMVPPAQRHLEEQAEDRQRLSEVLQAGYLAALVLGSAASVALPDRTRDAVATVFIAVALLARLALAYRPPSGSWVRARSALEEAKAQAWRRGVTGTAVAGDSVRCRALSAAGTEESWRRYRVFRVRDQRTWFERRSAQHARSARGLRAAQTVLAVLAVLAAVTQAVAQHPLAWAGLLGTVLAAVEAWGQFRRSGYIAASYAAAARDLVELEGRTPGDLDELATLVDEVERVLDRELWTWVAISSPAVLVERHGRATGATMGR